MSEQWVVTKEEWYPVYERDESLKADGDYTCRIEVSDEDAAFIVKVREDFDRAQEILHAAYEAARDDGKASVA